MNADPRLIRSTETTPDWPAWDAAAASKVTTIHLGQIKPDGPLGIELPPDLANRFGNVTHLRLWGLDLAVLPALPEGLRWLEIRNCMDLERLPPLPATLETLDFGGCHGLAEFPKNGIVTLRRLHIDDCAQIPETRFNGFLEDCAALEELTAENCVQLVSLNLPGQVPMPADKRGQLQRLVLRGCEALRTLPELSVYPWLRHVNVNVCSSLAHLPALPISHEEPAPPVGPGLQYFTAHKCPLLRSYGADRLDLRPVHLSEDAGHNVAPMIRTLHDLGTEAGELVMSKLLLLGSGRCGKTTIAKALQWYGMDAATRVNHPDLNPAKRQKSTDGIHFWQWTTPFEIGITEKTGRAFLWDFAGQEVYHNTHRLFASQGAVFIIAITSEAEHKRRLALELREMPEAARKAYADENEYRELKYWLDYLRSALGLENAMELGGTNPQVSVLVVHTGPGTLAEVREYLSHQAGPYADLVRSGDLPIFLYDWEAGNAETEFGPVRTWVRRALGKSADGFGIRGPKLFQSLSEKCSDHLTRDLEAETHQPVIPFTGAWRSMVESVLRERHGGYREASLSEIAAQSARYLHNCGQIFWLRQRGETEGEIILNQAWSCQAIYSLCDPLHPSTLIEVSGGIFDEAALRKAVAKKCRGDFTGQSENYRSLFLDLLDKCDVCVRAGNDGWIAIQRELLRESSPQLIRELEQEWEEVQLLDPGAYSNHSFSLFGTTEILLGSSDFRGLVAWLARNLHDRLADRLIGENETGQESADYGDLVRHDWRHRTFSTQCRMWRDGMQIRMVWQHHRHAPDEEPKPEVTLLLRVEWRNAQDEGGKKSQFEGGLFLQFLTPDEDRYAPRLKKTLFEGDGPLSFFKDKLEETDQRAANEGIEKWGLRGSGASGWAKRESEAPPRGTPFDIAVSYRSADRDMVDAMSLALRKAGLRVYNYDRDLDFKPEDGGSKITEIYDYLKCAKVILVVPSDAYFQIPVYDPEGKNRNLYSPVELAEAILAWEGYSEDEKKGHGITVDSRPATHFFWVADKAVDLSPTKISEKVGPLLTQYHTNVTLKRLPKPEDSRKTPVVAIDKRESKSVSDANDDTVVRFLNEVGRDAKKLITIDMNRPDRFKELFSRIDEVLKPQ